MGSPAGSAERLKRYLDLVGEPCGAVFDVGTRAVRLLVGPKRVPAGDWGRDAFFNDALVTNLGHEVNRFDGRLDVSGSPALASVARFLGTYGSVLERAGVAPGDVAAVGTAVFRWMANQRAVADSLHASTGVRVTVLEEAAEARLSLCSLAATHTFRRRPGDVFPEGAALLLLDQGGGSLEVSYVFADDLGKFAARSLDRLGTIALRREFFEGPDPADPGRSTRTLSDQLALVGRTIRDRIVRWEGYPELRGRPVAAYGMGSAITAVRTGNNYDLHNTPVTLDQLDAAVRSRCAALEERAGHGETLWRALGSATGHHARELDALLVALCGVPVYRHVLERIGLTELRVCGYGLRYGVYAARYRYGIFPGF